MYLNTSTYITYIINIIYAVIYYLCYLYVNDLFVIILELQMYRSWNELPLTIIGNMRIICVI